MAPAGARGFTARFDSAGRTEKWMIIFSRFTMSPLRKLRSLVGGQEHMEHIEHVFSYIIPGLAPRGRSVLAPFPSLFYKSMCSMCSVCSHRENPRTRCVPSCVPVCSANETGGYFTSLLRTKARGNAAVEGFWLLVLCFALSPSRGTANIVA